MDSFETLLAGYRTTCTKYETLSKSGHLLEAQAALLEREARIAVDFSSRQRALEDEVARLKAENERLAQAMTTGGTEREMLDELKAENARLIQARAAYNEERDSLEEKLVVSRRNYREALNEVELITEQLKMTERELQDANERIAILEQRKGRRRSGTSLGVSDSESSLDTSSSSFSLPGRDLKRKRERSLALDHLERALTGIDDDTKGGTVDKKRRKNATSGSSIEGKTDADNDSSANLSLGASPLGKASKPLPFGSPDAQTPAPTSTKDKKKSVRKKGMNYAAFLQKNKGITVPKVKKN